MLSHPSPKFFRQLLFFGLIVWIVMFVVEYTAFDVKTQDEAMALELVNYHGAVWSYTAINTIYWGGILMFGLGLILMLLFISFGRLLIIGSLILDFLTTSFLGLVVSTGSMDMLGILVEVLVGIPVVLSFFEPCSKYFNKPIKMQNKAQ